MDQAAARPRRPEFAAPRRVATAPMTLESSHRRDASPSALVETLYNHPDVKIVAFNAAGKNPVGTASKAIDCEEPGTLSPSSQLERTIAFGPFRIYRAPGSVAFLSCGTALKPILPKSQCWCIDQVNSKFVLQIRRPNYWRIELPVSDPEDQRRALLFRAVLDGVLQFEKTECPFKRSFTVELPEAPSTPVKKKPWTPVKRPISNVIPEDSISPAQPEDPFEPDIEGRSEVEERLHVNPLPEPGFTDSIKSDLQGPANNPGEDSKNIVGKTTSNPYPLADMATDPPSDAQANISTAFVASMDHPLLSSSDAAVATETARIEQLIASPDYPTVTVQSLMDETPATAALSHLSPASAEKVPALQMSTGDVLPMEAASGLPSLSVEQDTVVQVGVEETPMTTIANDSPSWSMEQDTALVETPVHVSHVATAETEPLAPVDREPASYGVHEGAGSRNGLKKAKLRRTAGFKYAPVRSVTTPVPPKLTLVTPPLAKSAQRGSLETTESSGHVSPAGSQDSFHSVQSWHSPITPLPPSPPVSQPDSPATFPFPHDNIAMPRRDTLDRQASDFTVTPGTGRTWEVMSNAGSEDSHDSVITAPDTSATQAVWLAGNELQEDGATTTSAARTTQRLGLKHRGATNSITVRRRALSPLPPAANVFSPKSPSERPPYYLTRLENVRKIPMAIIAKTYEILLGPPSHLIALMLRVAARITAGEWTGRVYGYDDKGDQIPVQWDYSEGDFSDWSDDDEPHLGHGHSHGMPRQGGQVSTPANDILTESESWDVD